MSKLREAKSEKKVNEIINAMNDDEKVSGRRGVMPLNKSVELVKQKVKDKKRQRLFAERVSGSEEGMSF